MSIGADSLWFSDHAPFPNDPFGNRMQYSELHEYITSLNVLKNKYRGVINIHTGLEVEYFPSFDKSGYYKYLKELDELDFLLLGQHMAETGPDEYTFSWSSERKNPEEYKYLAEAEIKGNRKG